MDFLYRVCLSCLYCWCSQHERFRLYEVAGVFCVVLGFNTPENCLGDWLWRGLKNHWFSNACTGCTVPVLAIYVVLDKNSETGFASLWGVTCLVWDFPDLLIGLKILQEQVFLWGTLASKWVRKSPVKPSSGTTVLQIPVWDWSCVGFLLMTAAQKKGKCW